jgi:hypothetical protein
MRRNGVATTSSTGISPGTTAPSRPRKPKPVKNGVATTLATSTSIGSSAASPRRLRGHSIRR